VAGMLSENSATAESARLRILVVDDFPAAAESLAKWLRQLGHDVQTATDGHKGIEAAQCFAPDLVFLDIIMPDMNGYEVARHIRQQPWGEKMRLIALTALGGTGDRQRSRDAGFDAHLVKPTFHADIVGLLAAYQTERGGVTGGGPRSTSTSGQSKGVNRSRDLC
jgi:CheY-like chemotaxis protein